MILICDIQIKEAIQFNSDDCHIECSGDHSKEITEAFSRKVLVVLVYPWEIIRNNVSMQEAIKNRISSFNTLTVIYGGPGERWKFGEKYVNSELFTPTEYKKLQTYERKPSAPSKDNLSL